MDKRYDWSLWRYWIWIPPAYHSLPGQFHSQSRYLALLDTHDYSNPEVFLLEHQQTRAWVGSYAVKLVQDEVLVIPSHLVTAFFQYNGVLGSSPVCEMMALSERSQALFWPSVTYTHDSCFFSVIEAYFMLWVFPLPFVQRAVLKNNCFGRLTYFLPVFLLPQGDRGVRGDAGADGAPVRMICSAPV